jgi:uncharacterized membrane protein YbhN (UPF0104 family)
VKRALRVGGIAAVLAGMLALVVWRGPSLDLLENVFTAVVWEWVAASVLLNFASVVVRAVAWRTVIEQAMPPPRPSFRSIFSAFSIGLLGNAALPGRIGELARVAVLTQRLPWRRGLWANLAGTVFAHRIFDFVPIAGLVLYVIVYAQIPQWLRTSLLVFLGLGLAGLAFSVVWARSHGTLPLDGQGRVRTLVAMAREGLGVMRAPAPAVIAIFLQCLGWLTQLFAVYTAMRAFQIEEPLVAAAVVLLVMNVATVFPLWPGNLGLMQAAVALALVPYGIQYAHGFGFGLGLQAIEASVGIGLGLAFAAREGLTLGTLGRMPEPDEDEEAEVVPEVEDRPRARVSI